MSRERCAGRAGCGWAVAGWRCFAQLWRDLSGEVGRALAGSDVHAKCVCTGTGMCLQPAPCFSERKNTSLQLEKQKGGGPEVQVQGWMHDAEKGILGLTSASRRQSLLPQPPAPAEG